MTSSHPTSECSEAYIALGANLGQREQTLAEALNRLHRHSDIEVVRCSGVYETDPVGYLDQPQFLNMAALLRTRLTPEELLQEMLRIEASLGRVRDIPNGPRTVDLDLLWVEGEIRHTADLTLPHPRMLERAFVLVPLHDILPIEGASEYGDTVREAIAHVQEKEGVRLWTSSVWDGASGPSAS